MTGFFSVGSAGYFTLFEVKEGIPIFTNNMIFIECGVIALFEAFYIFRDHNHVKMKFWDVKWLYLILLCLGNNTTRGWKVTKKPAQGKNFEISFFKLKYYHFWCINFEMNLTK